jgi:hypothetical protein
MLVSVFHPCAICRGVTERISFLFSFSSRNLQSSSILCSLCLLYMGMGFSTESCYGCMTCPLLPDVNKLFDFLLWLWLHLSTGPGYWINLTHRSYFRCSLARYPGSCAALSISVASSRAYLIRRRFRMAFFVDSRSPLSAKSLACILACVLVIAGMRCMRDVLICSSRTPIQAREGATQG